MLRMSNANVLMTLISYRTSQKTTRRGLEVMTVLAIVWIVITIHAAHATGSSCRSRLRWRQRRWRCTAAHLSGHGRRWASGVRSAKHESARSASRSSGSGRRGSLGARLTCAVAICDNVRHVCNPVLGIERAETLVHLPHLGWASGRAQAAGESEQAASSAPRLPFPRITAGRGLGGSVGY